jgi:hypothetical protein
VLGAGVLVYDLLADEGMTLSEGCDHYLQQKPWLTRAVGLAVAGHVLNLIPESLDPVHGLFVLTRRWRRT